MMNTSPSPFLKPEKPMTSVAPSRTAPRQSENLLPQDVDRFGHSRFGTAPDEDVVIDERSQLSPSQAVENRLVAHFVHFTPTRRTATNEFIEDSTPVNQVSVAIRTDAAPTQVYLAPSREPLPFRMEGNYCHITVPTVLTSQLVVFEGV